MTEGIVNTEMKDFAEIIRQEKRVLEAEVLAAIKAFHERTGADVIAMNYKPTDVTNLEDTFRRYAPAFVDIEVSVL